MARGSLTVVGTGLMVAGQITQESLSHVQEAEKLFFVAPEIVTATWLEGLNPSAESLFDSYQEGKSRSQTYAEMTQRILAPVREGKRVVAAFYGHPGVFATPSHESIRQARQEGYSARMLPGVSAEDCLFADLGIDPGTTGCQSFEATDFLIRHRSFDPTALLVLWQIGAIGVREYKPAALWSTRGLEVLAAELSKTYGAEHETIVYESAVLPVSAPKMFQTAIRDLATAPVTTRSTLAVLPLPNREADPIVLRALGVEVGT
jgi:precorrin-6B methylase 1